MCFWKCLEPLLCLFRIIYLLLMPYGCWYYWLSGVIVKKTKKTWTLYRHLSSTLLTRGITHFYVIAPTEYLRPIYVCLPPIKNTNLLLPPTAAQLHRLKDAHKLSQSCLVSIMTTVITIMFSVTWWNIGENVYSSLSSSDPKCVPPTLARWGLSTTDILYQSMNSLAGNWLSEKLIKP